MKMFAAVVVLLAVSASAQKSAMSPERKAAYIKALSQQNSLQPEWHMPKPEGNGLVGLKYTADDHMTGKAADDEANKEKFHGGTHDVKETEYNVQLGQFDLNNTNINMTPYVIQTKDERWEAGVPNYEAPENGYLILTFDEEADARAWVIEKTGADTSINYPLAPDVDAEFNLPNPANPDDLNPNTMQDNAPTNPPKKQMGHMEPAYVGEYTNEEIFGDTHSDTVEGTAEGTAHGDLQKSTWMETGARVRSGLKNRRSRANRN